MTPQTIAKASIRDLDHDVSRFLYIEAALLDERRWDDWLALWTEDANYSMPIRSETLTDDAWGQPLDAAFSRAGELHYFDEPKLLLAARVVKLKTGKAWAEQPPSHTTRLITNIHVVDQQDDEVTVHSNFLVHRTRGASHLEQFIGTRRDRLQRHDDALQIAERVVLLNTNVLDASNLQVFF